MRAGRLRGAYAVVTRWSLRSPKMSSASLHNSPRLARLRPRLSASATVLAVALVAGACGSDGADSASEGTTNATPPTTQAGVTTTVSSGPRSAPRWETVETFSGTGTTETASFPILAESIQWRVRWSCEGSGAFILTTTPAPTVRPGPIAEESCPEDGEAFAIHTGDISLGVQAQGAWTAIVDQQIDIPLMEPALPGMTDEAQLASGDFYDLEKEGSGRALLYDVGGTRYLRLEDFNVTENIDLFVWLTDDPRPPDSAAASTATHVELGNLKSTVGDQNYEIPAGIDMSQMQSVVIWCEPVSIAYAAAPLSG